ncbi:MAG: FecR domain-containing protein [Sphingomonadales bacterium]
MTSNLKKKLNRDRARQAADFVALAYSGNISEADEKKLATWLAAHPDNRTEYQAMLDIWDASGDLADDPEILSEISQGKAFPARTWNLGGFGKVAAAAGFLIIAITSYFLANPDVVQEPQLAAYATEIGEQETVTLADGSLVTLNTNTELRVDYTEGYRHLILSRGEAYFDVAKDQSRPFTVEAGSQSVTALGTQFNILRDNGQITVAVIEGVVAVHDNGDLDAAIEVINGQAVPRRILDEKENGQFRLEAGGVGTFSKTARVITAPEVADITKFYSWRDGVLRFEDETLEFVINNINRYTSRQIILNGADARNMRISGVFLTNDIEGVLKGLEATLPIEVELSTNRVIIEAKK